MRGKTSGGWRSDFGVAESICSSRSRDCNLCKAQPYVRCRGRAVALPEEALRRRVSPLERPLQFSAGNLRTQSRAAPAREVPLAAGAFVRPRFSWRCLSKLRGRRGPSRRLAGPKRSRECLCAVLATGIMEGVAIRAVGGALATLCALDARAGAVPIAGFSSAEPLRALSSCAID